jgi:hypothetical protein
MFGPKFGPQISLGNVITILTLIIGAAISYAVLTARSDVHAKTLADHEARLRVIENNVAPALARIDERLLQLQRQIEGMKNAQTP